jgi:hypothetical protein
LVLVATLLPNLAMVSLWSWRTFASSQGFADVTTDMLKEPAVRGAVAEQIANALEQEMTTAHVAGPLHCFATGSTMSPSVRTIQRAFTRRFGGSDWRGTGGRIWLTSVSKMLTRRWVLRRRQPTSRRRG